MSCASGGTGWWRGQRGSLAAGFGVPGLTPTTEHAGDQWPQLTRVSAKQAASRRVPWPAAGVAARTGAAARENQRGTWVLKPDPRWKRF